MGITIHYRGRLNEVGQLSRLCTELADIARAMGWEATRLDDDWDQPANARLRHTKTGAHIDGHLGLKGIVLRPEVGTEPLSFLFDREGNLRSMIDMVSILDGTLKPEDARVFVKTQFAPPEVHVWIVGLLKYLKKHYLADLQVSDEGEYWETGDIHLLRKKMAFLGQKIEQLARDLSSVRFDAGSGLSADEIAEEIERWFLQNRGENAE